MLECIHWIFRLTVNSNIAHNFTYWKLIFCSREGYNMMLFRNYKWIEGYCENSFHVSIATLRFRWIGIRIEEWKMNVNKMNGMNNEIPHFLCGRLLWVCDTANKKLKTTIKYDLKISSDDRHFSRSEQCLIFMFSSKYIFELLVNEFGAKTTGWPTIGRILPPINWTNIEMLVAFDLSNFNYTVHAQTIECIVNHLHGCRFEITN